MGKRQTAWGAYEKQFINHLKGLKWCVIRTEEGEYKGWEVLEGGSANSKWGTFGKGKKNTSGRTYFSKNLGTGGTHIREKHKTGEEKGDTEKTGERRSQGLGCN